MASFGFPQQRMDERALSGLSVIVPNLNYHYSGVTATSRAVAPRVARSMGTAWFGPHAPDAIARLTMRDLMRLRFGRGRAHPRVWHARRNVEMLAGWLLRLMGWRFKLLFSSAGQRRHSWITRFLIARMDAVIAVSEISASYLERPASVVLHGVDTDLYRPIEAHMDSYAATGLPGRFAIGCFGRVRRQKGTDVFVDAMCALLPRYPDFSAVVIGAATPDQRIFARALRQRIEAAGLADRIRFLGELPIEEVPRWYQRLTIFAFTSRVEGFGLTLLEAMAAGVALVAARAGAADTVIAPDTGVLVEPGNVEALIAAIEPLMRDPQRAAEMGRRARAHVLENFSIDAEATKIAAIYRQLLAR
jgi:mannosyltransferase